MAIAHAANAGDAAVNTPTTESVSTISSIEQAKNLSEQTEGVAFALIFGNGVSTEQVERLVPQLETYLIQERLVPENRISFVLEQIEFAAPNGFVIAGYMNGIPELQMEEHNGERVPMITFSFRRGREIIDNTADRYDRVYRPQLALENGNSLEAN